MASVMANSYFLYLKTKLVDESADTYKIILMQSGFVFNRATHKKYSDVSASELATAYGYTAGGATLSGVSCAQNDTIGGARTTWSNASWSVSGGNITASGAIIYNSTHADAPIAGYIDFSGDQTTLDGGVATVANPDLDLVG